MGVDLPSYILDYYNPNSWSLMTNKKAREIFEAGYWAAGHADFMDSRYREREIERLWNQYSADKEFDQELQTAKSTCAYWKEEARITRILAARYSKQLREAGLALDNLTES